MPPIPPSAVPPLQTLATSSPVSSHPPTSPMIAPSPQQSCSNTAMIPALATLASVLWQIWRARNGYIFRSEKLQPFRVVQDALAGAHVAHLTVFSLTSKGRSFQRRGSLWQPPDPGKLKINVDGSHRLESTEGTMACVCRDHHGRLTDGFSKHFPATYALQAEIQAVSFTLQHLQQRGLTSAPILLESD